jgi:hypothetical protein
MVSTQVPMHLQVFLTFSPDAPYPEASDILFGNRFGPADLVTVTLILLSKERRQRLLRQGNYFLLTDAIVIVRMAARRDRTYRIWK